MLSVPRFLRSLRIRRHVLDPFRGSDRPDAAFEQTWRRGLKQRVIVVVGIVGLWGVAIESRLVQLQVFQHDELQERALRYQQRRIELEAVRGDIVDRRGAMMAYSVEALSLIGDPSLVENPPKTAAAVCAALGDCAARERRDLAEKLAGSGQFVWIRRSQAISPEQVDRVKALKLPGIATQADTRRYYPRYELAAHVLGFVGRDNQGQAGVEHAYDKLVRGEHGVASVQVDAKQQRLESRVERPPVPGATLELTLDLSLQYIAERELKAGVDAMNAKGGTAIIMAPRTGEILALANYPTFNPNVVGRSSSDDRRNRATQDVYEPGSTFKIVTAAAAFEEGVVRPEDLIDTSPGYYSLPGRRINDTHSYGVLSFEDVIVKSSNVGAVKVGLRTGVDRLSRYVHRFGFGEVLSPDFLGQSRGLWNPKGLDESGLASVSMGYQVAVTPLQMAAAVSAVANGGLLMQPRVVRAVIRDGRREVIEPKVLRRSISPETAATLTTVMEGVVSERGTARAATIAGHQVAGKTGTARKLVDGRYSTSEYNASFVGFVPSRQPVFTILVVIDTPRAGAIYGGSVAAPVFKRIAEAALAAAGVPATVAPEPPVIVTAAAPRLPARPSSPPSVVRALAPVGGVALMPDVTGLSARDAVRILTTAGLSVRPRGAGFVVRQFPEPGAAIEAGGWGIVDLDRRRPELADARGAQ